VRWVDLAGYAASSLVFLAFYMKGMVPLRLVALFSNFAFLVYAGALHLLPIVLLHGALIPINLCRLSSAWREQRLKRPATKMRHDRRQWRAIFR
jgi:CRP/FNR family cyclic AMP-dependent transcriptional regulator